MANEIQAQQSAQVWEEFFEEWTILAPKRREVVFTREAFEHFVMRDGRGFNAERADLIGRIETVLLDPNAEWHVGWDAARRRNDLDWANVIAPDNTLVVLQRDGRRLIFKTAYVAAAAYAAQRRLAPLYG